jgi:hypothetical protein
MARNDSTEFGDKEGGIHLRVDCGRKFLEPLTAKDAKEIREDREEEGAF